MPDIQRDIDKLIGLQTAEAKRGAGLKGHELTRSKRQCEEYARRLAKLAVEKQRAMGVR
jgi:hypothetical protein